MVSGTGVAESRKEGNTGGVRLAAGCEKAETAEADDGNQAEQKKAEGLY